MKQVNITILSICLFVSLLMTSCDDTGGIFGKKVIYVPSVDVAPTITSTAPTSTVVDIDYTYEIIVTGSPAPTLSVTGLPVWLSFNAATRTISGSPSAGDVGATGTITITASNDVVPNAVQTFVVTVTASAVAPAITSTAQTTATVGVPYSYVITVTGSPTPTVIVAGLPGWLSFNSGTRTMSGTPSAGDVGTTGTITITASNGELPNGVQTFVINVSQPQFIVSGTITVSGEISDINGAELRLMDGMTVAGSCVIAANAYSVTVQPGTYSLNIVLPDYIFTISPGGAITVVASNVTRNVTVNSSKLINYLKASNTTAGDRFSYSASAIDGDTVVIGAYSEDSATTGINGDESDNSVTNSGAAYVFVRTDGVWSQEAYLKASNTGSGDYFGRSVAISGDTIAVSAPYEDSVSTGINGNQTDNSSGDSGAVYIFVRNGINWSQEAYLKASNTGAGDLFGIDVAIDGNTLVIGAYGEKSAATGIDGDQSDNNATWAGAGYVFIRNAGNWSQQAYLKASNTEAWDCFGYSVAISVDTIVIGANGESSAATGVNGNQTSNATSGSGAAYVFTRSGTVWSQQAYLKASNTGSTDNFGISVSIDGNTAVVGAWNEDSAATGVNGNQTSNTALQSGAAYVFIRDGINWSQQAYLKASNTGTDDFFGRFVDISGNTIVVGTYGEASASTGINGNQTDNSAPSSGAAYVFTRTGSTWFQQSYLKSLNTETNDNFGYSIAIDGDTVVVGAYGEDSAATGTSGNPNDNNAVDSGAAYVYVIPPLITSSALTTASYGDEYSYHIQTTMNSNPSITVSGLPAWLSYNSGTQTISGTPAIGDVGTTGSITISASNGVSPDAVQTFTITVYDWTLYGQYVVIDLQSPYTITNLSSAPSDLLTNDIYKTTKIVLRRIPAGTFQMGRQTGTGGTDELPVHPVSITDDFYIAVFEVTQRQWYEAMGTWPSYFTSDRDKRPVEMVSWNDIKGGSGFVDVLSGQIGESFDLPTEAQWEYCCKAGTSTYYSYGNTTDGAYMWYDSNSGTQTHDVGTRLPNSWNLYDMHGNVFEWCRDWHSSTYYQTCFDQGTVSDPIGPATGTNRVARGGSWYRSADYSRSSCRGFTVPDDKTSSLGLRVVVERRFVAPIITSSAVTDASVGMLYTYSISTSGLPMPSVSVFGLPAWLSYNSGTQTISGTPAISDAGTTGTITVTASNGVSPDSVQTFVIAVEGTVIFVNQSAAGLNNGTSWANAYTSLQTAITAATTGKSIWIAAGTYKPTASADRALSFTIPDNVNLYGGFAGSESVLTDRDIEANPTILSGDIGAVGVTTDNSYHVVVTNTNNTLDGLIIERGNANHASTTEYQYGGGIYAYEDTIVLSNCILRNNLALERGGALYSEIGSTTIDNCEFTGNSTARGGAIYTYMGTAVLTNSSFDNNHVSLYCGVFYTYQSTVTISHCVFTNNSADTGQATVSTCGAGGTLLIENCLIACNTAPVGSALGSTISAILTAKNCTIVNNYFTSTDGGSIVVPTGGTLIATNCILWSDLSSVGNEIAGLGSSTITYSCVRGGYAGAGNISSDPLFIDAANNNFKLASYSPCIDAGNATDAPTTDFDGNPRFDDAAVANTGVGAPIYTDIGAYERQTHSNIIYVDCDATGSNNGTSWANAYTSLQSAITAATTGKSIWVAEGTYKPTTGTDRSISFQLVENVNMYGGFDGIETSIDQRNVAMNPTILSGDIDNDGIIDDENSYHVVLGADAALIDGFIIQEGNANNLASTYRHGGGMQNINVSPIVQNCIIRNNRAINGGGIYNYQNDPVITNCEFSDNTADYGGGVYNFSSTAEYTNCLITRNHANYFSGASRNVDPGGNPVFINCTFADNTAVEQGGITSRNNTSITLINCIVWNNLDDFSNFSIVTELGALANVTYSCIEGGYSGIGNINSDPNFVDSANDDFRLNAFSPCIDSANGTYAPETDLDGNPRFDDLDKSNTGVGVPTYTDIGAYERQTHSNVIYVNCNATGSNNGTSWANAYTSLQTAIAASSSGKTIWIAEGTYKPAGVNGNRLTAFSLKASTSIYGGFSGNETALNQRDIASHPTILSGDLNGNDVGFTNNDENSYTVIIGANYVTIDGLTITGGNSNQSTGDWWYHYRSGGGIYNTGLAMNVESCTFINNSAQYHGGAICTYSSNPDTINNCKFIQNKAGNWAGAVFTVDNSMTITNSEFYDNTSASLGGAIIFYGSTCIPTVKNCIFSGNTATSSGGVLVSYYSKPTLINCTFVNNSAAVYGGAMYNIGAQPTLKNCIFRDDTASSGAEIRNRDYSSTGTVLTVSNCDIEGGLAGIENDPLSSNIDSSGNIDSDPLFVDATNDDYRLRVNSPCIDSGSAIGSPIHDIDGILRDLNPDMGAYEFTLTNRPNCIWRVNLSATGNNNGSNWTDAFTDLQDALSVALSGDEIWVAAGTYKPSTTGDRYISFVIPNDVKVYGGFEGDEALLSERDFLSAQTVLSGDLNNNDGTSWPPLQSLINDNSFHVVRPGIGSVIDGFIIERGNANDTSTTDWPERNGAGVFGLYAHYNLKNCKVRFNSAEEHGAGIVVCYNSATIENCLIYRNRSYGSYNIYGKGAGLYCGVDATAVVRNCTFVNNVAEQYGGAICIVNSVFTGQNIVMYDNMSGAIHDQYHIISSSVSFSYSCSEEALAGTGNIITNPLFIDAANNDYRLSIGSPCIDSGSGSSAPEFDIEGNPRVDVSSVDNTGVGTPPYVDIGAYEFQD